MATENKYQKSIDRLNQAIGKEIATTLQYLYFHVHFEDDGYEYFSKMMKQTSITEMFHTDKIADRIISTSPCRKRMRSENSSIWRISAIEISRMIFERY